MSDFEMAKKYYNKLLKMEYLPAFMLVSIALNYIAKNMIKQAKEVLLRAFKQEPRNLQVLFHLGEVFYLEKNYENAKQFLEEVYNFNPNVEVANLLAQINYEMGEYSTAETLFGLVKLSVPNNISVILNLAKCRKALGDKTGAKFYIEEIMKIFPEHEEAQEMLAELEKDEK